MGKIKDLTNLRFGRLVAIEKTDKRINRCVVWKCKCDCGNYCEVKSNNLLTGHTQSCGCLNKESCSKVGKQSQIIDETGKQYSKLTVLSFNSLKGHNAYWNCQCDCGNKIVVAGNHLRSGHTQSCGCLKSIGEEQINQILTQNKIYYQSQYAVLINGSYYRFDFAIIDKNTHQLIKLIEYDGEQHFPEFDSILYPYEQTHKRDLLKNNYCKKNNIPLIRIPYWEKNNLTLDLILGDKYIVH